MANGKHDGFTLVEILIAVAILTLLTSAAIYSINSTGKISVADELLLRQVLTNYIPEQVKRYYLSGDSVAWADKVSQIEDEMASWSHIQNISSEAKIYNDNGIELKFKTVYKEQSKNEQLFDILTKSPMIESVVTGGNKKQRFTVKYKLN